jgi:hypothetical protein
MGQSLKNKLDAALIEKDVENTYRQELLDVIKGASITSPHGGDGLLEFLNDKVKSLRLLLEFKLNEDFKKKINQCSVLIQCLYYIKKHEDAGEKLPNVIFVGDKNECFALHTNAVVKYLAHEIDWSIAPSSAAKNNPTLLKAMLDDQDVVPFVYNVEDNFKIETVVSKIQDLNKNVVRLIRVTPHNINAIFDYFLESVYDEKEGTDTANQIANTFIQILVNPKENYLHPNKKNTLITKAAGDVCVNGNQFKSFFSHFEHSYGPKEKESMTGMVDRLVEDSTRRKQGEFFTPTLWVDEGHKLLTKNLGEDWKQEYVVWDCACGTMNLTRDYRFGKAFCSTLVQEDIDTANQMNFNPEAVRFQYDFLNEGEKELLDKAPSLVAALKTNKKILFLINPPYATANNAGTKDEDHKAGVAKTAINEVMKQEKWGAASQQLYAQFLYKIFKLKEKYELDNVEIALYSKPAFLASASFNKFREKFFSGFQVRNGFLFQASEFADVSGAWGVSFSHITDQEGFEQNQFDLKRTNAETFEIEAFAQKEFYNLDDGYPASKWVREEIKGLKTFDAPQVSSALKVKQKGVGKSVQNSFGYIVNVANSVYKNGTDVFIVCATSSMAHGLSVIPENFHKVTTLFTARKTIIGKYANWINDKDEYLAPDENHPKWKQFVADSLVYSLFNNSSQQSSLRQVDYKDKKWDIKNEFFWLPKAEMIALADENQYDALYNDGRTDSERHVANLLWEKGMSNDLSPDALKVLSMATALLKKSMTTRQLMSESRPDAHLDSWDAGYAQLKLVWQEYHKEEFKVFRNAYKEFEDRMRPQVYELGFLKGEPITV